LWPQGGGAAGAIQPLAMLLCGNPGSAVCAGWFTD
jgi:hypothetical protein